MKLAVVCVVFAYFGAASASGYGGGSGHSGGGHGGGGGGYGSGGSGSGSACIVKGSYCNCHYCKCEKGQISCSGYGHGGGYGEYSFHRRSDLRRFLEQQIAPLESIKTILGISGPGIETILMKDGFRNELISNLLSVCCLCGSDFTFEYCHSPT